MAAWAGPDISQRPVARPAIGANDAAPAPIRPVLRPAAAPAPVTSPSEQDGSGSAPPSAQAIAVSLRPEIRPDGITAQARARQRARERGMVCNDPALQGEFVGQVAGRVAGCGLRDAIRVRSVSGILLTQQAVMDCGTARALKTWVEDTAQPALRAFGGGLARLKVAAHYVCRTRNHQPGARISEHGKGRAIDISGFILRDGSQITVAEGWNARSTAQAMRRIHRGACGPFGTVLGPEADSYHQSHFHFDTAQYRSGPYCR
jgi:hypothetical protein